MAPSNLKEDGRRLPPALLKSIVVACFRENLSGRALASQFGVSPSTISLVKAFIARQGRSEDEFKKMTAGELAGLFYTSMSQPDQRKEGEVYYPNFVDEAYSMEGDGTIKTAYERYCAKAREKNLLPMSRSNYYRGVKPESDLLHEQSSDYYLAQYYEWGMEMQIDYAGMCVTLNIYGTKVRAWLLVVAFPKSYYCEARFVRTMKTTDACQMLDEIFKKWRKTPCKCVCDNGRQFISKHLRGQEAVVNSIFGDFMDGYTIFIEAAVCRAPQRKSCVEFSVNLIQNVIKRHIDSFTADSGSFRDHNERLQKFIDLEINEAPFRRSAAVTRKYLFENYELPAMKPLPETLPELYSIVKEIRVPRSFLIKIGEHSYSVPYTLADQIVTYKLAVDTVSFWHKGRIVARHARKDDNGVSINPEHQPPEKREMDANNAKYSTPEKIKDEAQCLNPGLYQFVHARLELGNGPNDRRCCIAVINQFKRVDYRDLYAEACRSVLMMPTRSWTSYEIMRLYNQVVRENEVKGRFEHQSELFSCDDKDLYLHNQ